MNFIVAHVMKKSSDYRGGYIDVSTNTGKGKIIIIMVFMAPLGMRPSFVMGSILKSMFALVTF